MQKNYFNFNCILFVLLICSLQSGHSKDLVSESYIDSLSLHQFQQGNWDNLIETGKLAKQNNVDFKWLQQRIGYAYFMKQYYYQSMQHYEKALTYAIDDDISHLYLYYIGINTGDLAYARYHAGKLSVEYQQYTNQSQFKPLDAIDIEVSYKSNQHDLVENAQYKRFGLNSLLGYQLDLYQTITDYQHEHNLNSYTTSSKQNEYYALLNWNMKANTNISLGYHYVGTRISIEPENYFYPGNIVFGKISHKINRFDLAVSTAVYNHEWVSTIQPGIHVGMGFSGLTNTYFSTGFYHLMENGTDFDTGLSYQIQRNIFKQTAGIMLFKRLWTEYAIVLGNLNNFVDNNGMYLYNALDQTVFRNGLSLFGYLNKSFTLYVNYTYDKKRILQTEENYKQHGITGGIIWKI